MSNSRTKIINTIGAELLVKNLEADEFSYPKALQSVGKTINENLVTYNGTKHKNLDASSEKIDDNQFAVMIAVTGVGEKSEVEEEVNCQPDRRGKGTVVVLSSDVMGTGDESLGKQLIKGFVFALTKMEELPSKVILYNRGAFLSSENEDTIQDLKTLEAEGVEILTCGTCLNHYGLAEKLAVGTATNMYEIVESMMTASHIVKPS